ncbi:MAG: alpha/beta hydrolase [Gammaproteobacteria bacterium]|nr:alpha/beta hydrolase [Gammaproteobacteria bacterium]
MDKRTQPQFITLQDGRSLSYSSYGPAHGKPVFIFHGIPGSRLEHADLSVLEQIPTRLITMDRPGHGQSDFMEDRQLLDWPDDVSQLADSLSIDKFTVMGFSGGGSYAAACAYKIPHRLNRVVLLSSTAPFEIPGLTENIPADNRALFELAAQDYQLAAEQVAGLVDQPEAILGMFEAVASNSDKQVLQNQKFRAMYLKNISEACRQEMTGVTYDMSIAASPWGFDVADIDMDIELWHGLDDATVPVAMANYLAESIPNCHARLIPGKGHFLMFEQWAEVLKG